MASRDLGTSAELAGGGAGASAGGGGGGGDGKSKDEIGSRHHLSTLPPRMGELTTTLTLLESYGLERRGGQQKRQKSYATKEKELTVHCHLYLSGGRALFAGCSDGSIRVWKPKTSLSRLNEAREAAHAARQRALIAPSTDGSPPNNGGDTDRKQKAAAAAASAAKEQKLRALLRGTSTANTGSTDGGGDDAADGSPNRGAASSVEVGSMPNDMFRTILSGHGGTVFGLIAVPELHPRRSHGVGAGRRAFNSILNTRLEGERRDERRRKRLNSERRRLAGKRRAAREQLIRQLGGNAAAVAAATAALGEDKDRAAAGADGEEDEKTGGDGRRSAAGGDDDEDEDDDMDDEQEREWNRMRAEETGGLLFSCSADRTIKLWDPWDVDNTNNCVQTLVGHAGSVTSIAWCRAGFLVSCSGSDGSIRIWKRDPSRALLLYPFFTAHQTITPMSAPAQVVNSGVSLQQQQNAAALASSSAAVLRSSASSVAIWRRLRHQSITAYVGDASGRLHVAQSTGSASGLKHLYAGNTASPSAAGALSAAIAGTGSSSSIGSSAAHASAKSGEIGQFKFDPTQTQTLHTLSVTTVVVVPSECFVITLSFDHTAQIVDALTGDGFFAVENPNRCRYTAVAWDSAQSQLLLADQFGWLQIWNVYVSKCLKQVRLATAPILALSLHKSEWVVVSTPESVTVWKIERKTEYQEFRGHESAIVALVHVAQAPQPIPPDASLGPTRPGTRDGTDAGSRAAGEETDPRMVHHRTTKSGVTMEVDDPQRALLKLEHDKNFYSASHDHTIRCWAAYDMSCLSILQTARASSAPSTSSASTALVSSHDASCGPPEISAMTAIPGSANTIVTGHEDGRVHLWNVDSGSCLTLPRTHSNTVSCLIVCNVVTVAPRALRRQYLVSGSYDGWVTVWDITRKPVKSNGRGGGGIQEAMAIGGTGSAVAGSGMIAGSEFKFKVSEREVLCLEFDAYTTVDARTREQKFYLLTAGNDMFIRVYVILSHACHRSSMLNSFACSWDFNFHTHECRRVGIPLAGHTAAVTRLVMDANFVISGSDDQTIRVWDWKAGFCVRVLTGHTAGIRDLIFLPSLGFIVSCAFDGFVLIWDYLLASTPQPASVPVAGSATPSAGGDVASAAAAAADSDLNSCIVQRYRQANKRFRCLLFNATRNVILAGTEEANILTFPIDVALIERKRKHAQPPVPVRAGRRDSTASSAGGSAGPAADPFAALKQLAAIDPADLFKAAKQKLAEQRAIAWRQQQQLKYDALHGAAASPAAPIVISAVVAATTASAAAIPTASIAAAAIPISSSAATSRITSRRGSVSNTESATAKASARTGDSLAPSVSSSLLTVADPFAGRMRSRRSSVAPNATLASGAAAPLSPPQTGLRSSGSSVAALAPALTVDASAHPTIVPSASAASIRSPPVVMNAAGNRLTLKPSGSGTTAGSSTVMGSSAHKTMDFRLPAAVADTKQSTAGASASDASLGFQPSIVIPVRRTGAASARARSASLDPSGTAAAAAAAATAAATAASAGMSGGSDLKTIAHLFSPPQPAAQKAKGLGSRPPSPRHASGVSIITVTEPDPTPAHQSIT